MHSMQDAGGGKTAASTLSVPSVNSEPMGEGVTVPKRWDGEGSTTNIPVDSTVAITHGDEDEVSMLSSDSIGSTNVNVPASTATTTDNAGVEPQVVPVGNSATHSGAGAENTQAETGSGAKGLRHVRYDDSTDISGIPDLPVVIAKEEGHAKAAVTDISGIPDLPEVIAEEEGHANTAVEPRARLRRARRDETEASKAEARRRFWDGVKPARADSNLGFPLQLNRPGLSMVTLRAAMKLKKKANVIQAKSVMHTYILNPRSPRMRYWKNWMVVNIMFTVLVTPWRISFQSPAEAFGLVLAGIVNISYIVDTVLHFFTAVETESALLTDRKEIARRYLTSWFLLDLLTCFPYTTVLRNIIPASMRVLAPMRGLRLLKLLKVVKVYTMHYEVSVTLKAPPSAAPQ